MNEKTVVITESECSYHIQNNGISDFALIGILECILFELKTAKRSGETLTVQKEPIHELVEELPVETPPVEVSTEVKKEEEAAAPTPPVLESSAPAIRTRIKKAIEAIHGLGGEVETVDLSQMSEDELQVEFEELTSQYKRLKSSQTKK